MVPRDLPAALVLGVANAANGEAIMNFEKALGLLVDDLSAVVVGVVVSAAASAVVGKTSSLRSSSTSLLVCCGDCLRLVKDLWLARAFASNEDMVNEYCRLRLEYLLDSRSW